MWNSYRFGLFRLTTICISGVSCVGTYNSTRFSLEPKKTSRLCHEFGQIRVDGLTVQCTNMYKIYIRVSKYNYFKIQVSMGWRIKFRRNINVLSKLDTVHHYYTLILCYMMNRFSIVLDILKSV